MSRHACQCSTYPLLFEPAVPAAAYRTPCRFRVRQEALGGEQIVLREGGEGLRNSTAYQSIGPRPPCGSCPNAVSMSAKRRNHVLTASIWWSATICARTPSARFAPWPPSRPGAHSVSGSAGRDQRCARMKLRQLPLVIRPPALSTISRQCRRLGRCDCYSDSLSRFGGVACGPDGTLAGIL